MRDTDTDWETFAQQDPYWAVITADQFRREHMDAAARATFFVNGEGTIAYTRDLLSKYFGCPERFDLALDFGCGVGRLLFPLARRSRSAVGVDVSPSMLAECRKNAAEFGLGNITLRRSDDTLSELQEYRGKVDLLTSLLVLQHIPPSRGFQIFGRLLDLLGPFGFGNIQLVTGIRPPGETADSGPVMEMNPYDLNAVMSIMQEKGIHDVFCDLSHHDGLIGVNMLFCRRQE
jgi:SAM-dependent methyltransferase